MASKKTTVKVEPKVNVIDYSFGTQTYQIDPTRQKAIRERFTDHFKEKKFDEGLLAAVDYIDNICEGSGSHRPDLVLIDLNLPKVDGLQVLAHLRNHPLCGSTPVVIVTSSDAPRDRERATRLGAALYFRKPSEFDEFMQLGAIVKDALAMK